MRITFDVATDTGHWTGISPNLFGSMRQMAWKPATGDTGGDLQMVMLPTRSDDTGSGWLVFDDNDCLGTDFVKAPRQRQHGADGNSDPADTGAAFGVPIVFDGDRLAVKVIPGGAAVVGTLHIWLS